MRIAEFKEWANGKVTDKAIKDGVSRCKKIEMSLKIDLDTEYAHDGGQSLLTKLAYSPSDERAGKPAPAGFEFTDTAKIRFRMTDLRSAAKRYFKFCQEVQTDPIHDTL